MTDGIIGLAVLFLLAAMSGLSAWQNRRRRQQKGRQALLNVLCGKG